jgi:TetR/AcrR family transcriptional regulator, cholesterol catabolism regulator
MTEAARASIPDRIIDAVVDLLDSDGYDGWSVSTVARLARVSLRDVYKHFPSHGDVRAQLISAALKRWIDNNAYSDLTPAADAPLRDGLTWCFRKMLEPWEDHSRLLEAYQRARATPAGCDLDIYGLAPFFAAIRTLFVGLDRSYVDDLSMTLASVLLGLITQVVRGEIALADVVPTLERTVFRMTSDNTALAQRAGING